MHDNELDSWKHTAHCGHCVLRAECRRRWVVSCILRISLSSQQLVVVNRSLFYAEIDGTVAVMHLYSHVMTTDVCLASLCHVPGLNPPVFARKLWPRERILKPALISCFHLFSSLLHIPPVAQAIASMETQCIAESKIIHFNDCPKKYTNKKAIRFHIVWCEYEIRSNILQGVKKWNGTNIGSKCSIPMSCLRWCTVRRPQRWGLGVTTMPSRDDFLNYPNSICIRLPPSWGGPIKDDIST